MILAPAISPTEAHWRKEVAYMAAGNPLVARQVALVTRSRLIATIEATGGRPVRVIVRRAMEPAPEVVIETRQPAAYLKHELRSVLRVTRPDHNVYLAVVDGRGTRILEWAINGDKTPNTGSVYVKHGLESCSPVVAIGWPSHLPPCPVP
jgi:hypothetical protein